ncbi:MAG: CDP-alcohol phosphatidyltransferase family protein [Chthoniobacterales bacterium]
MAGLAFRAREIEELADVCFFRPLGILIARPAAALGLSPTQITIFSMFVGLLGGALLYHDRLALAGFGFLIAYSVLDSADGQLARLTGQATELGRVLDGVIGYVVYAAIYLALTASMLQHESSPAVIGLMFLAIISNIAHGQMYEYHRHHYISVVLKGRVPQDDPARLNSPIIAWLYRGYLACQRALNGAHAETMRAIASRAPGGIVSDVDRDRYREYFYAPVRGWNFLGDNTRFYAIGVLALIHRLDLFFAFMVLPMNCAFLVLWFWERRADERFLRE